MTWLIWAVLLLNYYIKDVEDICLYYSVWLYFCRNRRAKLWNKEFDQHHGQHTRIFPFWITGNRGRLFVCFWTGFSRTMCVFVSASWLWLVLAERTSYQTFCPHRALACRCVVFNPCLSHSRGDRMWQLAVFLLQIHTYTTHFLMVYEERCLSLSVCSGLLLLIILNQMSISAKQYDSAQGCICAHANLGGVMLNLSWCSR